MKHRVNTTKTINNPPQQLKLSIKLGLGHNHTSNATKESSAKLMNLCSYTHYYPTPFKWVKHVWKTLKTLTIYKVRYKISTLDIITIKATWKNEFHMNDVMSSSSDPHHKSSISLNLLLEILLGSNCKLHCNTYFWIKTITPIVKTFAHRLHSSCN
jgi:hypothetical protein